MLSSPSSAELDAGKARFLSWPLETESPTGVRSRPHIELQRWSNMRACKPSLRAPPGQGRDAENDYLVVSMLLDVSYLGVSSFIHSAHGTPTVLDAASSFAAAFYKGDPGRIDVGLEQVRPPAVSCTSEPLARALRGILPEEVKVVLLSRAAKVPLITGLENGRVVYGGAEKALEKIVFEIVGNHIPVVCNSESCPKGGQLRKKSTEMLKCTVCQSTFYCNDNDGKCQKDDWKGHKLWCPERAAGRVVEVKS